MRLILLIVSFSLFSCSDSEMENSEGQQAGTSVPFPTIQIEEFSKDDLKILNRKEFLSKFVKIKPGEFMMGSPVKELGRSLDEIAHKVMITNPFYISKFETTIYEWNELAVGLAQYNSFEINAKEQSVILALYKKLKSDKSIQKKLSATLKNQLEPLLEGEPNSNIMSLRELIEIVDYWEKGSDNFRKGVANSLNFKTSEFSQILISSLARQNQLPVSNVSYTQATAYCHNLTNSAYAQGLLPKNMLYRLPTEAEWEYACRSGTLGVCGLGDGSTLSGLNANLDGGLKEYIIGSDTTLMTLINRGKLIPVGGSLKRFPPNNWGVYDMHGSVMEWCYDFYAAYDEGLSTNPIGPIRGNRRVLRGGSFYRTAFECRSANRDSSDPTWRGSEIGFRVVLGYPIR